MNNSNIENLLAGSADLLIELGCEELPPKSLPRVGQALFDGFLAHLNKAELGFDAATSRLYYTPRRLALLISGVAGSQPDQVLERKGPALAAAFSADKQPTPAALGFARSVGKDVQELETFKTDKGEWLYCRVEKAGQKLEDLIFPMLEKALAALPVAKPMRWASNDFSFIRPVHWLVVMHGSKILEGSLFGLKSGNTTRGHRIHSPGPHEIATAGDYKQVLEAAHVVADQDKRQDIIRSQAEALGETSGGKALINQDLLNEVTCLVEWPQSISGSFDVEFLDVPAEALIASMQDHQKFFPIVSSDKAELVARFITVTNIESQDFDAVREGFERVIRPRLADARFFWDQDNKKPLQDLLPLLDNVVFQEKLGSIRDKSKRISSISKNLAEVIGGDKDAASRAATLCKCDLVSHMVGEFPELQGIMGSYYA
ncbi:MAG: glycine--tRNA ligase subunit beta, partial [Gammaproteobacteria bacterium]|nr:glycine--tRNA ligase subunit beta [Gammaproteobacteria bacterium]